MGNFPFDIGQPIFIRITNFEKPSKFLTVCHTHLIQGTVYVYTKD